MIPVNDYDMEFDELELEEESSKTYRLDFDRGIISGWCDELEAMKQAIYLMLNTERYEHMIYSWDYGVEMQQVIGMDLSYAVPELQRAITEALLQDDRIIRVSNFRTEIRKSVVDLHFEVETIFGEIEIEKEVTV